MRRNMTRRASSSPAMTCSPSPAAQRPSDSLEVHAGAGGRIDVGTSFSLSSDAGRRSPRCVCERAIKPRSNAELTESDIPTDKATWDRWEEIPSFAASFNGYQYRGSFREVRGHRQQGPRLCAATESHIDGAANSAVLSL